MNHFQRQSIVNSIDGNIREWSLNQQIELKRNYSYIEEDAQFKSCKECSKQIPWNQDYCRNCWLENTGINLPII